MRKIPFAGIELTSQRVRGLRGTSELPGRCSWVSREDGTVVEHIMYPVRVTRYLVSYYLLLSSEDQVKGKGLAKGLAKDRLS